MVTFPSAFLAVTWCIFLQGKLMVFVILLQVRKVNFLMGGKFWLLVKTSEFATYSKSSLYALSNYMTKTIVFTLQEWDVAAKKRRRNYLYIDTRLLVFLEVNY